MSTIEKRNGAYRITVSCGVDVTGKQIRRRMTWKPDSGMTAKQIEKELQRQKVLFEEQCAKGLATGGNIKLADFIELFFKNYAVPMLKKKTITSYRGFTPVVNQALGHLRIDKIKPHHLNEFYHQLSTIGSKREDVYRPLCDLRQLLNEKKLKIAPTARACGVKENTLRNALDNKPVYKPTAQALCAYLQLDLHKTFQREQRSKPLSAETIRHYNAFLSTVFSTAIKWEMLDANPCSRATLPHKEKKKPRYLDEEQAAQLLELLEQEDMQHKTMIKTLMFLGLRREELCGLEWKDINFENNVIEIERASVYIPKEGVLTDTTKNTSSQRFIKAPTAAMQMLRDYRLWQNERKQKIGDRWEEHDRLFTRDDGKPIHPDTITGWFRRFVQRNQLPDISIHSLRHTNATLMIHSGVPLPTISARLGHADTSTTAKIYVHAIKSADAAAAETLDNIFDSRKQSPPAQRKNTA